MTLQWNRRSIRIGHLMQTRKGQWTPSLDCLRWCGHYNNYFFFWLFYFFALCIRIEWHIIFRNLLHSIFILLAILVDCDGHCLLRLAWKLPLLMSLELLSYLAHLCLNPLHWCFQWVQPLIMPFMVVHAELYARVQCFLKSWLSRLLIVTIGLGMLF